MPIFITSLLPIFYLLKKITLSISINGNNIQKRQRRESLKLQLFIVCKHMQCRQVVVVRNMCLINRVNDPT